MRVSGGLMGALPGADSTQAVVEWLLLIGALFIALQMIFGMAYKALTDSFSSFSNSVRLATGMPVPPQGQGVMSTIGRVATGAAMGGIFGGGPGALAGAAGELINAPVMASWKGGQGKEANQKDAGKNENPRGNVFLDNGLGTVPPAAAQKPEQNGAGARAGSAFVSQPPIPNLPGISQNPLGASGASVMNTARSAPSVSAKEKKPEKQTEKPAQSASAETTRAVFASKSLFPDER
jgi:hypothetical protein